MIINSRIKTKDILSRSTYWFINDD